MLGYIQNFHVNEINQIVNASSAEGVPFRSLAIDLAVLEVNNRQLFDDAMNKIWKHKSLWIKALNQAQNEFIRSSK
jgi:hypothetical protein